MRRGGACPGTMNPTTLGGSPAAVKRARARIARDVAPARAAVVLSGVDAPPLLARRHGGVRRVARRARRRRVRARALSELPRFRRRPAVHAEPRVAWARRRSARVDV